MPFNIGTLVTIVYTRSRPVHRVKLLFPGQYLTMRDGYSPQRHTTFIIAQASL
jgi:hypothetical protein